METTVDLELEEWTKPPGGPLEEEEVHHQAPELNLNIKKPPIIGGLLGISGNGWQNLIERAGNLKVKARR